MKEIFYKCTLKSDVVLNSNLATEGNMTTLDYIPGSNFLGMVASKLYNEVAVEKAMNLFHNGSVSFGDATISQTNQLSFSIPLLFFQDKLAANLEEDTIFLHHLLTNDNKPKRTDGSKIQLKQSRTGYLLEDGTIIKEIKKNFALKSAQDRNTRTSADGKMFGFQSLEKGQEFIFSIQFKNEDLIEEVEKSLIGTQRLGKSKSAEFGQVNIEKLENIKPTTSVHNNDYILVYAQSNLCFIDEIGLPKFQPSAKDLGLDSGEINWEKSQINTHSYSPWNFTRNTPSTQRFCIAKGSVFYVESAKTNQNSAAIGSYQAEGLGRVLYNPFFIKGNSQGISEFKLKQSLKDNAPKNKEGKTTTLTNFLRKQLEHQINEMEISKTIHDLVYSKNDKNKEYAIENLKKISSSQWGGIRAYATKTNNWETLKIQLFGKEKENNKEKVEGYLTHGVADEKYWGKNRAANLRAFKEIFEANKNHGTLFIAKFAAEMAKENKRLEKGVKNGK